MQALEAVKPTKDIDIEQQAAEARKARAEKCQQEVNGALATNQCQLVVSVQVGDQVVPVTAVLSGPVVITVQPNIKE